jgi:hypothetical protein
MDILWSTILDNHEVAPKPTFLWFQKYLSSIKLEDLGVSRASSLGKALRVMRFIDPIALEAKQYHISPSLVIALAMTESYWDPWSINENDGWAWLLHTQRTTVQLINNLIDQWRFPAYRGGYFKTIATHPDYKEFFAGRKNYVADSAMAKILLDLMTNGDTIQSPGEKKWKDRFMSYDQLQSIDDRLNPTKSIQMATMYLSYCKKFIEKWYKKDTLWGRRKSYKEKYGDQLLKQYLIMNAFNKWPGNYTADFTPEDKSTHIGRVVENYEACTRYFEIITKGLSASQDYKTLLNSLIALDKSIKNPPWPKDEKDEDMSLQPWEFVYFKEDPDGYDIYKYKISQWWQTVAQIKKILIERFNKEHKLFFGIDETMIVDVDKKQLPDKLKIERWTVVYILLPSVWERIKKR